MAVPRLIVRLRCLQANMRLTARRIGSRFETSGDDAQRSLRTILGKRRKRALPCPERSTTAHRIEHRAPFGRSTLREHPLDPRPTRARRADVDAAAHSAPQTLEAILHDPDAGERLSIEW